MRCCSVGFYSIHHKRCVVLRMLALPLLLEAEEWISRILPSHCNLNPVSFCVCFTLISTAGSGLHLGE